MSGIGPAAPGIQKRGNAAHHQRPPPSDKLPVTVAAQEVQVSAYPDAYAKHENRATQIVDALHK